MELRPLCLQKQWNKPPKSYYQYAAKALWPLWLLSKLVRLHNGLQAKRAAAAY